jgi:hypothetical protein
MAIPVVSRERIIQFYIGQEHRRNRHQLWLLRRRGAAGAPHFKARGIQVIKPGRLYGFCKARSAAS